MISPETISDKIRRLRPEFQEEVDQLVDRLLAEQEQPIDRQLKLDWRGGLSHLKHKFTSVDLQHDTLNLRED